MQSTSSRETDTDVHKVLVVENNPTILKLVTHFLEAEGCEVIAANNGLEALVILDTTIPDIIFTDIIMPKISGDQLCRLVRRNKKLKDIFIAVHSSTTLEDNRQLLGLDADAYIAKGPRSNTKKHIQLVLDQFKKGVRRDETVIGGNGLHPRAITHELLLTRRHYQAIFNNVSEAVVELNSKGQIIQANKAALRLFGQDSISLLSSRMTDYLYGSELDTIIQWIARTDESGASRYRSRYSDPLTIGNKEITLNLVSFLEEEEFYIIGILQDITFQRETEGKLAKTLEEFNAVLDTIDYGVLLMDSNLRTRMYNQALQDMLQLPNTLLDKKPTLGELINHNRHNNIYDVSEEEFDQYVKEREELAQKGPIGPVELKFANGTIYEYQCTVLPDNGRMLTYYNISNLKSTQAKLARTLEQVSNLANHDPLTGLPNLRLARERLTGTLSMAKRQGWKAAIMFIDLDGFKNVNDSYGHDCGDELLKLVAQRLLNSLREADTVARIGGDEFLIIQTEVAHRFAAANVADKIVKHLANPFHIEEKEITIGASIGIALYPEHGEDRRTLLKKADDAMYYTKRIGKNGYTFSPS